MKKIIANAPLCVLPCTAGTHKEQTNIQLTHRKSCLPTRMHPVQLKKITEDILNKICTDKGTTTDI